jgi:ABC-type xylose transport system substrate-binding protein
MSIFRISQNANTSILFLFVLLLGTISVATGQDNPTPKISSDDRALQELSVIAERKNLAERYVSIIKAKFANDAKTLSETQIKYERAKAKFDAWTQILELAVRNKKKNFIKGDIFRQKSGEAVTTASEFEAFAEALIRVEKPALTLPNPQPSSPKSNSGIAGLLGSMKGMTSTSATATLAADPAVLVAEVLVVIGFKVYDEVQKREAMKRAAFADSMKTVAQWKMWGDIQADPTQKALTTTSE